MLERQTHRGGRDTVDHPRRGSDDLANAVCGCAALAFASGDFDPSYSWLGGPDDWQRARLWAHIMRHAR
jgi:hypothetical protein